MLRCLLATARLMTWCERMRAIRTALAELLGNSQSSYSLIESGRRADILHSTFEKLIQILHVTRDELAAALKNNQERTL